MNHKLLQYRLLLTESFFARERGSDDLEEEALDKLDRLWLSFTREEREESADLARAVDREFKNSLNSTSFSFASGTTVVRAYGGARERVQAEQYHLLARSASRGAPPVVGWCQPGLQVA